MYLAYYDESGDDGFPDYSSPLFVLTSVYLHQGDWTEAFEQLRGFRQELKDEYGLPVKTEFHTKQLLWNKKPYRDYYLSDEVRVEMVDRYCETIASLPVSIVNVCINKTAVTRDKYAVLDNALTYSIQRIENDLNKNGGGDKFAIITDFGRIGRMSKTARKMRAFNYIPSMIFKGSSYRQEIQTLIEDPLPKDSRNSFLIQSADVVAHIVYLHKLAELGVGSHSPRIPSEVTPAKVEDWLERLKPSLNLKASMRDPYGIVVYPKAS